MANAAHGSNVTPLTIATQLIPSAVAGIPYVVVLDATGGTPGYSWTVTGGQLPPGMSLGSSTGIISGSPTAGGKYSAEVTLSDSSIPAEKKSSTITISVAALPLAIVTSALPSAISGAAYSSALEATGGAGSYTWYISSGSLPGGLALTPGTGAITGFPSRSGTWTFTTTVHDGEKPAQSSSEAITLTVSPTPLHIVTLALAGETNNAVYSQTLRASGGTAGYTWSIVSGSLPAGLSLNASSGTISGMPAGGQSTSFTAAVVDDGKPAQSASASFTIGVPAPPLAVANPALPRLTVGTSYSQTLQASGGTAPYNWSVASGSLPNGLSLSSAGVLSGTPTASGSFTFRALVVDSGNPVQAQAISQTITVSPTPLKVTSPNIPTVRVGGGVSQSFGVSGGTASYNWRITSGSLPAGLALASSGAITGAPTQSGAATFTATVTDSSTPAQSASATAAIVVTPTPLMITSSSLGSVAIGAPYTQTVQVSGGSAPYTWSVSAGSLPAGLSLSASTGTISGIPTVSGTSAATITVTDSSSPAQVTSTATTLAVASATLSIVPASLAAYTQGNAYAQSLQATGGTTPYRWTVSLGSLPAGLSLSPSGVISGTPTSSSAVNFAVTVTDSGSPSQTQSASLTIASLAAPQTVAATTPLSIAAPQPGAATAGIAYMQSFQAIGGTPGYTWSIASGILPAGLTLSNTGTISGTPTVSGAFNFTLAVADNGSPAQSQQAATSITVASAPVAAGPATWFVRSDGGTRYSANVPLGQCDGLADVAYPGSGTNQHCAYNDFRYLWDDDSGVVGAGAWVIAGGDTVVIRGCHALPGQQNAADPDCRIGWDGPWGSASDNWCYGIGSYTCYNPPIPAGTPSNHTRILGACAYGTYNCTPIDNSYPYASTNETQLFGGFSLTWTFNLAGTQNVDIEGIELTTHNGQCVRGGAPAYPRWCNNNQPLDDYAQNGIVTDNTTANVTLQDVYIHGFNSAGLYGPIGGAITATRMFVGFNGFAGWNFADTNDTPDAPGSSITASYVTMIGNGCYEQYPIVNKTFPAQACYDDLSQGFGDAWSGQDTPLDTLICDHCMQMYNTKDGFIGPHTQIKHLTVTNSASIGNMGEQWKFGTDANATVLFQNNLTEGNAYRMSAALAGAAQNFSTTTGLAGSYLSDFGRAGGDIFSIITQPGSSLQFSGNSMVLASQTGLDFNCGLVNHAGNTSGSGTCGAVPIVWTNNVFVGYTDLDCSSCGGLAPGLWYKSDPSINFTSSHNLEFGIRNGDPCGTNNILCTDPLLQNEPGQTWPGSEAALDSFNPANPNNSFHPTAGSPLIGAGAVISGLTLDYYGVAQPTTPTIGAVAR